MSGRFYNQENEQQIPQYVNFNNFIPQLESISIQSGLTNEDAIFEFTSEGIDGTKAQEILDKFGTVVSSKLLESERNKDIKFQAFHCISMNLQELGKLD